MEDLSAMGQGEPSLDLRIAIPVLRGHVEIEEDPHGLGMWHQPVLLGTAEVGQAPQEKGLVGQVVHRPLGNHMATLVLPISTHMSSMVFWPIHKW